MKSLGLISNNDESLRHFPLMKADLLAARCLTPSTTALFVVMSVVCEFVLPVLLVMIFLVLIFLKFACAKAIVFSDINFISQTLIVS